MDKKQLRKSMIQKRLALDEESYQHYCLQIQKQLEELKAFQEAQSIALYMSYRHEVDTRALMAKYFGKKEIFVPKCVGDDLVFYKIESFDDVAKGYFGVDEPITNITRDINDIDFVVVPLLMFDDQRNRVGYGRGFYDRALKNYPHTTCGIAFSFQHVKDTEPHSLDVPLDMIITDEKIY